MLLAVCLCKLREPTMTERKKCDCGLDNRYLDCCGKYIEQGLYPQNAEALMRSRYTAYCLINIPYLLKTWHPDTRPELSADVLAPTQWQRLEVLNTKNGLKKSTVEFKAFYNEDGEEKCLHEHSVFKKVKNRWYYFDALHE